MVGQVSNRVVHFYAHGAGHDGVGKVHPDQVNQVTSEDRLLVPREVVERGVMLLQENSNVFVNYKVFVFFREFRCILDRTPFFLAEPRLAVESMLTGKDDTQLVVVNILTRQSIRYTT